jgi:hypothetical protein
MGNARTAVGFLLALLMVGDLGCGSGTGQVIPLGEAPPRPVPPLGPPPPAPAGFTSSVPSNRRLDQLSPTDRQRLCEDLVRFLHGSGVVSGLCRLSGWLTASLAVGTDPALSDAALQATCEMGEAQCRTDGLMTNCDELPSCPATVGEVVGCYSALGEAFDAIPECREISQASLASPPFTIADPPACVALEAKCPETTAVMRRLSSRLRR